MYTSRLSIIHDICHFFVLYRAYLHFVGSYLRRLCAWMCVHACTRVRVSHLVPAEDGQVRLKWHWVDISWSKTCSELGIIIMGCERWDCQTFSNPITGVSVLVVSALFELTIWLLYDLVFYTTIIILILWQESTSMEDTIVHFFIYRSDI